MTESDRTHRQANEYVQNIEMTYMEYLTFMLDIWEAKAQDRHNGGCGCGQCRKAYEQWLDMFHDESWRIGTWNEDEEEAWVQKLKGNINIYNSGDLE